MKDAVVAHDAPPAIGPYSQAVRAGWLLFLSGQIPIDPKTMELAPPDVVLQAERVLTNLAAVLAAAGCTFDDVVKTTIYLVDLSAFSVVNEVYERHVRRPFPARSTVQVAALPRGALIEIDAIALTPATH